MKCQYCGEQMPRNKRAGSKYCSRQCQHAAVVKRSRERKNTPQPKQQEATRKTSPAEDASELARQDFERMMDGSLEDMLRLNRDQLKAALIDSYTPASALPAISKQLIAICERLDSLQGAGSLFDEAEEIEVNDDVGLEII